MSPSLNIETPRLEPYALRVESFANAKSSWQERRGVLLRLPEAWGGGVGEAAPLPGYSPDHLDAAHHALAAWRPSEDLLRPAIFGDSAVDPESGRVSRALGAIRALVAELPATLPSARFAVETALLNSLEKRLGVCRERLLAASAFDGSPENRMPETGAVVRTADLVKDLSFLAQEPLPKAVKVKVGRPEQQGREGELLRDLRSRAPNLEIRLDANGAWSRAQARAILETWKPLGPRWIEEPWTPGTREELTAMVRSAPVAVALDESLWRFDLSADDLVALSPAALVLKPQLLGGCLRCLDLARALPRTPAIVSHTFDGLPAFEACRSLARVLDCRPGGTAQHHGLGLHAVVKAWPGTLAKRTGLGYSK